MKKIKESRNISLDSWQKIFILADIIVYAFKSITLFIVNINFLVEYFEIHVKNMSAVYMMAVKKCLR